MAEFSTVPWLLFDRVALGMCSITAREGLWWFTVCPALSAQRALLVSSTHRPQHGVMTLLPDRPRAVRLCHGSTGLWRIMLLAAGYERLILPGLCLPAVIHLVSSFGAS